MICLLYSVSCSCSCDSRLLRTARVEDLRLEQFDWFCPLLAGITFTFQRMLMSTSELQLRENPQMMNASVNRKVNNRVKVEVSLIGRRAVPSSRPESFDRQ